MRRLALVVLAAMSCREAAPEPAEAPPAGPGAELLDGSVDVNDAPTADVHHASAADGSADAGLDAARDDAATYLLGWEEIALAGAPVAVTEVRFVPGTADELLLLEKDGRVTHHRLAGSATELLGEFTVQVDALSDCGLISLAFAPDFATSRAFYLGYCSSPTHSRISRHVLGDAGAAGVEVVTVGHDAAPAAWHNVGSIGFDGDGVMWALFGDKALTASAQDHASPLGALVRLGDGGVQIMAKGLRSPWRGTRDRRGRYVIGDVGSAIWEEIDVLTAPGQNFGWPAYEGPCAADGGCDATAPIVAWDRSAQHPFAVEDPHTAPTSRRVVWVGPEVAARGTERYAGALVDRVLYGDFCAGWVRALALDDDGGLAGDRLVAHLEGVTSVDQAPDGWVYAATYGSCFTFPYQAGKLHRLVPRQ